MIKSRGTANGDRLAEELGRCLFHIKKIEPSPSCGGSIMYFLESSGRNGKGTSICENDIDIKIVELKESINNE